MPNKDPGTPKTASTPDSAFDRIGLSLSGGGFRASAYSLGTLNALYLLGLLDNVHMLSTASGGTLTGAYYALHRKQGKPFPEIYRSFYRFLRQDKLLPDSLVRWKQTISGKQSNYKLIQAFANIYDRDLYDQKRFDAFREPDVDPSQPFHLQSIIFGATELYSGTTFRFQHASCLPELVTDEYGTTRPSFLVGNGNVRLRLDRAYELRIADAVAASSCFPGGFEPLVLPDDFFPANESQPVLLTDDGQPITTDRIGLVDGGVYDNQGIESLLTANRRNSNYCTGKTDPDYEKHLDKLSAQQRALLDPSTLLLIADVDSAGMDLYDAPPPGPTRTGRSIGETGNLISNVQWGLIIVLLLSLVYSGFSGHGSFGAGLLTGLSLVGIALTIGIRWVWDKLTGYLKLLGTDIYTLALLPFQGLSIPQLMYLLKIRLTSVMSLLFSVFLRRVRGLDYNLLFGSGNRLPAGSIVLPSIIGGIIKDYNLPHRHNPDMPSSVGNELLAVYETVRTASDMSTTLWWLGDKHRMNPIIATAELTLCYRLLRRFEKFPPTGPRSLDIQRRAQLMWDAFQQGDKHFRLHPTMLFELENSTCSVHQLLEKGNQLTNC